MVSFLRQRLLSLPGPLALMIVVLLVLLIGVVDLFTGPEISMSIFFVGPVFIATWVLGLRRGVVTALVSALVWMGADVLSNHAYHYPWIVFWNTLVRLGFFLLTVALLAQVKAQGPGLVYCRNKMVYVSHLLKGHSVGLNEIDTGQWEVYFGPVKLGSFDERYAKGNSVPYLTLKV